MNKPQSLNDLLLIEMSRRNTDLVADLVFQKPELFDELFRLFLSNIEPVSRRAAWVLDIVSENMPSKLLQYIPEMVDMMPHFSHDGLKRHSVHMISRSPLPAGDTIGPLITICFDWLISPSEAVATKVYCMEILYRISETEPGLKKELADSIEWRLDEETPGFKNRGRKLLNKLYAEIEASKNHE
ncbi:MAG: hypothetical protein WCK34_08555 [Bacteroidota bacterium]